MLYISLLLYIYIYTYIVVGPLRSAAVARVARTASLRAPCCQQRLQCMVVLSGLMLLRHAAASATLLCASRVAGLGKTRLGSVAHNIRKHINT